MDLTNMMRTMPDGSVAVGPPAILDLYSGIMGRQLDFESRQKYHVGETVRIAASYDDLYRLFLGYDYPEHDSRQKAAAMVRYPYGKVFGAHSFPGRKEVQYDIDHESVGLIIMPESYIKKKQ